MPRLLHGGILTHGIDTLYWQVLLFPKASRGCFLCIRQAVKDNSRPYQETIQEYRHVVVVTKASSVEQNTPLPGGVSPQ